MNTVDTITPEETTLGRTLVEKIREVQECYDVKCEGPEGDQFEIATRVDVLEAEILTTFEHLGLTSYGHGTYRDQFLADEFNRRCSAPGIVTGGRRTDCRLYSQTPERK